jgi:hypothetical protein
MELVQINGNGSLSFDEVVEGTQVIDITSTEAFLVRKNGDGGDLFTLDTTNSRMLFAGEMRLNDKDGDGTFGGRIRYDNSDNELRIEANEVSGDDVAIKGNDAIKFEDSGGTKMILEGANITERMRISSDGKVGIGVTAPDKLLTLGQDATDGGQTAYLKILDTDTDTTADTLLEILWSKYHTGTDMADVASIGGGIEQWSGTSSSRNTYMDFRTVTSGSRTEKMRITSAGDILIKTADAKIKADSTNTLNIQAHNLKILGSGGEERFHFQSEGNSNPSEFSMKGDTENTMIKLNTNGDSFIHGKSNSAVGFNITAFSSNEGKIPRLRLRHSNNDTVGTNTAVDSGDDLGEIAFQGYDASSEYKNGASIRAEAQATFSTTEGTTTLYFNTSNAAVSGSANSSDKLVLDTNSRISLSNNDSNTSNTVFGKNAFNDGGSDVGADYNVAIGELAMGTGTLGASQGNVAIGYRALTDITGSGGGGDDNVAIGYDSSTSIATGRKNVSIGMNSLKGSTDADQCVVIGALACENGNVDVDGVVAVGFSALNDLIDGAQNTALGYQALKSATTGGYNVAVGYQALLDNVDGSHNTAVGRLALENFEPSSANEGHNSALGALAGNDISTGTFNTSLGSNSGHDGTNNLTTGTQNTFLGAYTNGSGANAGNQTVIGYNADGTGDNEIALGNTSISAIKAQVTSITAYSSDERTKKDVADYDLKGVDFIKELKLKTYLYKNPVDFPDEIRHSKWDAKDEDGNLIHERPSDPTETQVGLIAQEVEAALAKHGVGNVETYAPTQDSGIKTLTYGNLIFPLIKAVQELSARIEELESK